MHESDHQTVAPTPAGACFRSSTIDLPCLTKSRSPRSQEQNRPQILFWSTVAVVATIVSLLYDTTRQLYWSRHIVHFITTTHLRVGAMFLNNATISLPKRGICFADAAQSQQASDVLKHMHVVVTSSDECWGDKLGRIKWVCRRKRKDSDCMQRGSGR